MEHTKSLKQVTKPLKQVIAELQALEDANPGIDCLVDDMEAGADKPHYVVAPTIINEYDHVIIWDKQKIELNAKTLEFYNTTPEAMWASFTDEERGEESFEEWKADFERTKAFFEADNQQLKSATPVVVIKSGAFPE